MAGKGQFSCGTKTCSKLDSIETFEVPFQYAEAGKQKNALVKVCTSLEVIRQKCTLLYRAHKRLGRFAFVTAIVGKTTMCCRYDYVRSMDCN